MPLRIKALVCLAVAGGFTSLCLVLGQPAQQWLRFSVYFAAILLSSGMKVGLPKSEGTMSLNFPFILLGILQLSPLQAVCLAACSVIAQCRIRVVRPFTLIQILFNVANVTTATVLAWYGYEQLLRGHCPEAPALAVAAAIFFFSNTIPVALVIAWDQQIDPFALWRRDFWWFLPFYVVGAILAATAHLISMTFGWVTSLLLIPMVYTVYRTYSSQMAFVRDREQHAKDTEALHLRTIEGLAMAIEAKDQNTHKHLLRVRVYVAEMGKRMGLDEPIMQALLIAAYLHDIGKLAVPEYIINKPGKLTVEEFEKMKIHPVVGADILERVRFPYPVVPIVRSHNESWDGSGYPDGLKAAEIPIGARILTAVDCLDALASERPYRRAMPLDDAMAFVRNKAGVQFDPDVVRLLAEHYPRLEQMAREATVDIQPLNTDLFISRGEAPGNGYEPEKRPLSASENGRGVAARAAALRELRRGLKRARGVRETGAVLAHSLQTHIPFDCIAVYTRTDVAIRAQYMNGSCECAFSSRMIPLGEGLSGWVAENARCIVNGNPTVEPNFLPDAGLFTADSSALAVPLFGGNGVVLGAVALYSREPGAFSKDHQQILEELMPEFAVALEGEIRAQETAAEERTCHDSAARPVLEGVRAS